MDSAVASEVEVTAADVLAAQARLRRYLDATLSVGTWYLFNLALGIALPVGILKGIL